MVERTKKTIEVWDRCECGRVLHSMHEGKRGQCSSCWMKTIPSDTKAALNRVIAAAFRQTSDADKDRLVSDAMGKLNRDEQSAEQQRCAGEAVGE